MNSNKETIEMTLIYSIPDLGLSNPRPSERQRLLQKKCHKKIGLIISVIEGGTGCTQASFFVFSAFSFCHWVWTLECRKNWASKNHNNLEAWCNGSTNGFIRHNIHYASKHLQIPIDSAARKWVLLRNWWWAHQHILFKTRDDKMSF